MPTPSYIQGGSSTRGIVSAETGINVGSFSESFENPKEYLLDRFGGRVGFATDYDKSSTCSITGETSTAATAVMAVAQATATTIANQTDGYGVTTGDNYLDSIELSQDRGAWMTASLSFTRVSGLTTD